MISPRDRLIVALDVPTVYQAQHLIDTLGDTVNFYKIGMELVYGDDGLGLAKTLVKQGKQVFVDLKLLDIPNTVERATSRIADLGVQFLTIHSYPHVMEAAVRGAQNSNLELFGVTALTSFNSNDLTNAGYRLLSMQDFVTFRTIQAVDAGLAGIICSAGESAEVRNKIPLEFKIITPGIRPFGFALDESVVDDQQRIATVSDARLASADYIVVGRPITLSPNPKYVAQEIIRELVRFDLTYR